MDAEPEVPSTRARWPRWASAKHGLSPRSPLSSRRCRSSNWRFPLWWIPIRRAPPPASSASRSQSGRGRMPSIGSRRSALSLAASSLPELIRASPCPCPTEGFSTAPRTTTCSTSPEWDPRSSFKGPILSPWTTGAASKDSSLRIVL